MKINKPTYITDLTTEIMNNRDLLNAWAKNSVDMEFLELSVDILSDLDLLFSWDCNNILQIKLAGILSGNQDFKYKGGVLIKIDESYDFPFRTTLEYEYCIKEMIDMKSLYELHKKNLINQGVSLEQIKEEERYLKMTSFFHFSEMTKGYDLNDTKYLIGLTLPDLIERKNEFKKQFKEKKVNELVSPIDNKFIEIETAGAKTKELKEKPDFNRNHWNEKCFELFNYLIENYEKEGNIKFINIFYFLKKKISKEYYAFSFTIDQYKTFIEPKYGVKFKTFKKAQFDFDDNVVPILSAFESDFSKQV